MTRPEPILDLLVVTRTRIGVFDEEADGGAGAPSFEHSRQDPDDVALLSLADELRRAGAPAIHVRLQVGFAQLEARRTSVDDAAERRSMALAEGRHREQSAYRISGHACRQPRCTSCSRVIANTPPPPRSKSSQVNGTFGYARRSALSVFPTSTTSRPRGRRYCAASRRMIATES